MHCIQMLVLQQQTIKAILLLSLQLVQFHPFSAIKSVTQRRKIICLSSHVQLVMELAWILTQISESLIHCLEESSDIPHSIHFQITLDISLLIVPLLFFMVINICSRIKNAQKSFDIFFKRYSLIIKCELELVTDF